MRPLSETLTLLQANMALETAKGLRAVEHTIRAQLEHGAPRAWVRMILDVRVVDGEPKVGVIVQLETIESSGSQTGG